MVSTYHFCCRKCQYAFYSGINGVNWHGGNILVDCSLCNVAFEISAKDAKKSKKHFCSRICFHKAKEVGRGERHHRWVGGVQVKRCLTCGKDFTRYPYQDKHNGGKYCSVVCGAATRIKYKNPDERADMLFRKQELRQSMEYKKWKLSILKRDKKKCINCGSKKELQVHHIVPVSVDIGKAIDINNGQTLCFDCHLSVHGKKRVGISA